MKKLTTISLFIFFCVTTAILTAGLVFYQDNKNSNSGLVNQNINKNIANLATVGATVLDLKEISKHNKSSDCWLLINGKVYDITSYFGEHPGGSGTMSPTCGKDATDAYKTRDAYASTSGNKTYHSTKAVNLLNNYYIGDLNQKITPNTTVKQNNNNPTNTTSSNNIINKTNTNNTSNNTSGVKVSLTSSEVTKHNTNADCWIIVNSKIYDISNYASSHPGGTRNITNYCGKESTSAFDTKRGKGSPHSSSANNMLDQFFIGNLNQQVSQSTIDANVQKAKSNPIAQGGGDGEEEYEDD